MKINSYLVNYLYFIVSLYSNLLTEYLVKYNNLGSNHFIVLIKIMNLEDLFIFVIVTLFLIF
jgi:hypothetical protein